MDPTTLTLQAVGGFTVGALIGYVLRKAARWALVAVGFMLLPVFGLWYLGVLDVDWEGVNALVGRLTEWMGVNLSNMTLAITSTGALGVSGVLGFFFGATDGFRHNAFPVEASTRKYVKHKQKR